MPYCRLNACMNLVPADRSSEYCLPCQTKFGGKRPPRQKPVAAPLATDPTVKPYVHRPQAPVEHALDRLADRALDRLADRDVKAGFPDVDVGHFLPRAASTVYVASSLSNAERAAQVSDRLRQHGLETTYKWWAHGSLAHVFEEPAGRDCAVNETEAVAWADLLVVLLPGGPGTHVELGIALGADVPVALVGDGPGFPPAPGLSHKPIFYRHPNVHRLATITDLFDLLSKTHPFRGTK